MMAERVKIKQTEWNPIDFLDALDFSKLVLDDEALEAERDLFWRDLYAEYDARYLYQCFLNKNPVRDPLMSELIEKWWLDEKLHAQGFAHLYAKLYNESHMDIYDRLSLRSAQANFDEIEDIVTDQFAFCLLLAFDEIATVYSYKADMPEYEAMGIPKLTRWLRNIIRDEANHFLNAISCAVHLFPERICESESIVSDIVRRDLSSQGYSATFVLDHFSGNYGEEMINKYGELVLRTISKYNKSG